MINNATTSVSCFKILKNVIAHFFFLIKKESLHKQCCKFTFGPLFKIQDLD